MVPPPPVHAARLSASVTVDGMLDEAVWQSAEPASRFLQRDPVEGVLQLAEDRHRAEDEDRDADDRRHDALLRLVGGLQYAFDRFGR